MFGKGKVAKQRINDVLVDMYLHVPRQQWHDCNHTLKLPFCCSINAINDSTETMKVFLQNCEVIQVKKEKDGTQDLIIVETIRPYCMDLLRVFKSTDSNMPVTPLITRKKTVVLTPHGEREKFSEFCWSNDGRSQVKLLSYNEAF